MSKIINIGAVKRQIVPMRDFMIMVLKNKETARIVLPENLSPESGMGMLEIIMIGPKCVDVKIGDCVVISPDAMIKFKHDDAWYYVTKEENVTAVLRKEDKVN
jgi:co-chaperonin GroES (HSP10)